MNYGTGSIIKHPSFGKGVIVDSIDDYYRIYFQESEEVKDIGKSYDKFETVETTEAAEPAFTLEDIADALDEALYKRGFFDQPIKLGDKWQGGNVIMQPKDASLQNKEVPMETFFKKITSVREKLRVLEQNINNHEKLNEEEKFHLQQYISRAYGSLTTFNVLFAFKDDHFKGMGK